MTDDGERHSTSGTEQLTSVQTAETLAPLIDAVRNSIAEGLLHHPRTPGLVADSGVSPPAVQVFALLRAALTGRPLSVQGVRATVRYLPSDQFDASISELQSQRLVTVDGDDLGLSVRGRDLQAGIVDITCDVVDALLGDAQGLASTLDVLTDRALAHVSTDDGPAFRVLFPPYDPSGASPASRLAERLACLRFHRSDAHAAAWHAAGLTLEQVRGHDGPLPAEVERDTNVRASAPYEALTAAQRHELVQGLRSLVDLVTRAATA